MACGDWLGNIRIYNIEGTEIEQKQVIEAHDNEVICLAFSPDISLNKKSVANPNKPEKSPHFLLASGSRDKNICIFDSANDYKAITVLENHSHTVTSLHFYENKSNDASSSSLELISGSADKTVVIQEVDLVLIDELKDDLEQLQLNGQLLFKTKHT